MDQFKTNIYSDVWYFIQKDTIFNDAYFLIAYHAVLEEEITKKSYKKHKQLQMENYSRIKSRPYSCLNDIVNKIKITAKNLFEGEWMFLVWRNILIGNHQDHHLKIWTI